MKFITRSKYLFYYLWKLNRPLFKKFFNHVKREKKISSLALWIDVLRSVYKNNLGLMDYFHFRFYEKDDNERACWAGTGYKYEYDLLMNPPAYRNVLANKIEFYRTYRPFIIHRYCSLENLLVQPDNAESILENPSGKIILKDSKGQCGWGIELHNAKDFTTQSLSNYMKGKGFNLVEEFIEQHPNLMQLSGSGLNTIRIITQLDSENKVVILGARLRITVNSHVDNMASGNIAAPINIESGKVDGVAVYSDITKLPVTKHPVSGVTIPGFEIPFWKETLQMVEKAALHNTQNRSIGWDIAITQQGPGLLEGNHNWCKILWQLPVNQGMKDVLDRHLSEFLAIKRKNRSNAH